MKYIKTIFLMLITGFSIQAQSSLKGILQTDFSKIEQEKKFTDTAKKWGLKDVSHFENNDCNRSTGLDIAFLVDATSSMNDQIEFLKTEMNNMIKSVQKQKDIQIRTSAVFYRDKEEEYQVKYSDFDRKVNKTLQFIDKQRAAGGGDYPEDFALGFTKAVHLDWNQNADAKLLFLFCDAPPHASQESIADIQSAYAIAAKKGITIFPILGTAADFDTEVIMKTLADKSNGALISLQDENDPKFNQAGFLTDLIPRLMNNYVELEDCAPEQFVASKVFVYGNTSDLFSKEKLAGANLMVYKNGVFHQGKSSDQDGFYSLELKPGVYDFKFSYIGFQDKEIKNIIIGKEEELALNAVLQMGIDMETVIVTDYKIPLIKTCHTGCPSSVCSVDCFGTNPKGEISGHSIQEYQESISKTNNTSLFPNPANSYVNINAEQAFKTIKVFSSDGKLVFQQDKINDVQIELQVANWTAGMYLVYFFFEEEMKIEKLIIGRE